MLLSEEKHFLNVGRGLLHAGEVIHPKGKVETKKVAPQYSQYPQLLD
jgi:hypothetical protein